MTAGSKSDIGLLVLAGAVFVTLGLFEAPFSTYVWLLLFVVTVWTTRRAVRQARMHAAVLEQDLRRERDERVDSIKRLTTTVDELASKVRAATAVSVVALTEPTPAVNATPASSEIRPRETLIQPERPAAENAAEVPTETPPAERVLHQPPGEAKPRDWTGTIRSLLDLEQMLGTNWLSKIGVAVLVFGIAFFLAWQLRELGPLGKDVVGVVVSGLLLAAGAWGERSDQYRILARAALAGGWSLLFFVSYAAYHIPAAHVISSPLLALGLMLLVVAAMVAHTLRFRSQVVTGLAFALAFGAVALNRVDVFSLTANVVLVIGLCSVANRMGWFEMEIVGMGVAYLNHYLWLRPIVEPFHGTVQPFPEFYASAILLLSYWAVFRASFLVRPATNEKLTALAGVLNTVLLLTVMRYQSARPDLAFWTLLSLGIVELALGQLPIVRRNRLRFVVLSATGMALVVAAVPFRYVAETVSPIWLVEAELFFFVGILTGERVFRRLGGLAVAATGIQLFSVHAARVYGVRMDGALVVHHWQLGTIFEAAMLALYVDANWAPRRWPELFADPIDRRIAKYLTHTAAVIGAIGGWLMFPGAGAAVAWIVLAMLLAWTADRFAEWDLTTQANVLAVFAFVRVVTINLPLKAVAFRVPFDVTYRLLTVSTIVALGYLISRWNRGQGLRFTRRAPDVAVWAASILAMVLMWYELRPISVAVAWTIFGVMLFEVGETRHSLNLRTQGYVALLAGFARIFIVNLNAESLNGVLGPRVYTILPLAAALFYVHQRLYMASTPEHDLELKARIPSLFASLAAVCLIALARFEMSPDVVATAWAAITLLLLAAAVTTGRRVFLHIGIALALATLFRGVLHNLYERSYFPWPVKSDPWLLVGGAVLLLLATLPFAFRLRRAGTGDAHEPWRRALLWLDARPEQILFFVPLVLATALLGTEMRRGLLTVAWGAEAVAVFVFALWVGERSYRLAGLALLLLCVGKIFVIDFWSLGVRDKSITGILMGLALIGVSVLYTRKRAAIRQLL